LECHNGIPHEQRAEVLVARKQRALVQGNQAFRGSFRCLLLYAFSTVPVAADQTIRSNERRASKTIGSIVSANTGSLHGPVFLAS